jgi:hypothetical protein
MSRTKGRQRQPRGPVEQARALPTLTTQTWSLVLSELDAPDFIIANGAAARSARPSSPPNTSRPSTASTDCPAPPATPRSTRGSSKSANARSFTARTRSRRPPSKRTAPAYSTGSPRCSPDAPARATPARYSACSNRCCAGLDRPGARAWDRTHHETVKVAPGMRRAPRLPALRRRPHLPEGHDLPPAHPPCPRLGLTSKGDPVPVLSAG